MLMMAQAVSLIEANSLASLALVQHPPSPVQPVPDAMGGIAAVLLLTPAAMIKLKSQQSQEQQAQEQKKESVSSG